MDKRVKNIAMEAAEKAFSEVVKRLTPKKVAKVDSGLLKVAARLKKYAEGQPKSFVKKASHEDAKAFLNNYKRPPTALTDLTEALNDLLGAMTEIQDQIFDEDMYFTLKDDVIDEVKKLQIKQQNLIRKILPELSSNETLIEELLDSDDSYKVDRNMWDKLLDPDERWFRR